MTPTSVITVYFNDIVWGLTPLQRWDAVTKYHSSNSSNQWFIRGGIIAIAVLMILLLIQIVLKQKKIRKSRAILFDRYAKEKNLTDREYRILMNIAISAGLKRNESIFTLPSAFDRGATKMLEDAQKEQGVEASRQLQTELSFLREKIGLPKLAASSTDSATVISILKSQGIPEKKKLFIKRHLKDNGDLEATVVKNSPAGLTVEFRNPVEIIFGQFWICRYYSGTYVAEFGTTAIKCTGRIVVLKHSNNVRLINRRRFFRVPVKTPAYVANFPFKKKSSPNQSWSRKRKNLPFPSEQQDTLFEPPRFTPAMVTELGGPGLRIEADLNVMVGDRVLLVFKLDPTLFPMIPNRQTGSEKIIENVAKVRHVTHKGNVTSIALEFIDLDDSELDELVRTTNEVSIGMNKWRHYYLESEGPNKQAVKLQPA